MKNYFMVFLSFLFLILSVHFNTKAQDYNTALQEKMLNRTENEKKVSPNLFCRIFRYSKTLSEGKSKKEALKYFSPEFNWIDKQGRLLIMIRLNPEMSNENSNVKTLIINSGGIKIEEKIGHNGCIEIYSWVPIDKILNITSNKGVGLIEGITPPITKVTTAGDLQLKAYDVRINMNVTGVGNKIGVMSNGVKNLSDVQTAGELGTVNVLHPGAPTLNEGTAMLEIIYDLAYGA